jgi:hypothetical protein
MFEAFSKIFVNPPVDLKKPGFAEVYRESNMDAFLVTQSKEVLDTEPIDTSYYRKNVEDHLLFMPRDLAIQATLIDAMIFAVNNYYEGLSKRINKQIPVPEMQRDLFPPNGIIVYMNLHTHRKMYQLLSEFTLKLRDHAFAVKLAVLDEKKKMPDSRSLIAKLDSVYEAEKEGSKEFQKMLFPWQTTFKVDTTQESDNPPGSQS